MEIVSSCTPVWACLASLLAVVPIVVFGRFPNLREACTFIAGLVKLGLVASMIPAVLSGKIVECTIFHVVPTVPLEFRVDGLGLLFALVASFLWIPTSLYSIGYMRGLNEHSQTRFFAFFAISLSATLGVAFAGNLLTLYVFYELLSLSTYPLVTHHQDKEARTGGRTYLSHLLTTSIGFALPALIYCYYKSGGNLDFSAQGILAGKVGKAEGMIVLLALTFGFAKNGLMPFHSWLPGAMVAPTPVSALLHAVAVVKVGVFCVLRVFTGVFGLGFLKELDIGIVVCWIPAFTVLVSSLIALTQDNLKRRLAFSTIGQLAYIVLGVALLTQNGAVGSMMHVAMHAFGKITLFFCAGAIFVASGKKYISQMHGLGRQMPVTFAAFTIGALSVIGLPPLCGAWSKWYLILGAMDAKLYPFVAVLVVSSLLNVVYLLHPPVVAFFKPPNDDEESAGSLKEAPLACLLPLSLTALGCFVLFFTPGLLKSLALLTAGG